MEGLIGRKIGMTSIFTDKGTNVACTVVELGPCVVTQVKTQETDGYDALQLGFGERREVKITKALMGHFTGQKSHKDGQAQAAFTTTSNKRGRETKLFPHKLVEFRNFYIGKSLGETITAEEVFKGVGMRTHGQHNRLRHPGSVGANTYPAKVLKGLRMAGRTGGDRVTVKKLKVLKVFPEKNILLIKGAIPGYKGSIVIVKK